MKKIFALLILFILASCVEAGKFPPNRERLHRIGGTAENSGFCQENPDRCVGEVPW